MPARILFGKGLIDLTQKASIKVIQKEGKFQLCITLGLIAEEVPPMHDGDKEKCRDTMLDREIFMKGKANIGLKIKGSANDDTSTLSIAFDGDVDTKVPGTGSGLLPFNFDAQSFGFESEPEPLAESLKN